MLRKEKEKYSHQVLDSKLFYKRAKVGRYLLQYRKLLTRGWKIG